MNEVVNREGLEKYKEELKEYKDKFSTLENCQTHLSNKRWPAGFICPRCNNRDKYEYDRTKVRHIYQCKICKFQCSLTSGTIFHKTKTPLQKWFWMIFLVVRKKHIKTTTIQIGIGIATYKTALQMRKIIEKTVFEPDAYDKFAGLIEKEKLEAVKKRWLKKEAKSILKRSNMKKMIHQLSKC